MAEDDTLAGRDENSPGVVFKPFVAMEDLIDKLKLLNYDQVYTLRNYFLYNKLLVE